MSTKTKRELFQLGLIIVIIFLVGLSLFFSDLKSYDSKIVRFFGFIGTRITRPVYEFAQCGNKLASVKKLTQENRTLRGRIARLKELKKENESLKKELGVAATKGEEKIMAEIIGQSTDPRGPIVLINKGKKHGVKNGDNATLPGGILFGQVINTAPNYAKVIPVTNQSLSVAARHQESRVEGVLRGQGSSKKPVFDLMSSEKELKKGNVISSGRDQKFIPELLIGRIVEVQFYPQESSKRGKVEPAFELDQIESVFVISR